MRKGRHYKVLHNALKPLKVVTLGAMVFGVSACASLPSKHFEAIKAAGSTSMEDASAEMLRGTKVLVVDSSPINAKLAALKAENGLFGEAYSEESVPEEVMQKARAIVVDEIVKQTHVSEKDMSVQKLKQLNPLSGTFDFALPVSDTEKKAVVFLQKDVRELYSNYNICGLDEALGVSFLADYKEIVKGHEYFHAWQSIYYADYYKYKNSRQDKGRLAIEVNADHAALYNAARANMNAKSLEVWTDLRAWDFLEGHRAVDHATSANLNELLSMVLPDQEFRGEDPMTKIERDEIVDISARFHKIVDREIKRKYIEKEEAGHREWEPWEKVCLEADFSTAFFDKLRKMDVIADGLKNGVFDKEEAILGRHILSAGQRLLKIVEDYAEGLPKEKEIRFRGFYDDVPSARVEAGKVKAAFAAVRENMESYDVIPDARPSFFKKIGAPFKKMVCE